MCADKQLMFREVSSKPRFTGIWLSIIDLTGNVWLQLGWWILSDSFSEQSAFQWIDQVSFLVKHYTKFFYNTSLPCFVKCRPPLLSNFAVMLVWHIIFTDFAAIMIKTLVDFLCCIFISVSTSTSTFYIYYSAETMYSYHTNIKLRKKDFQFSKNNNNDNNK